MSQTTKKALAASLVRLLSEKPLDKITVVDIAEDCEVNRQTFYYHFQDIYDLVEWYFMSETTKALEG
ncbi:MAG: TetR family transcriptional regulator, partial [Oscillospiraceae bacterium]